MFSVTSGLLVLLFLVIILGTDVIKSACFYCSCLALSKMPLVRIFETASLKTVVIQLICFQIMV